MAEDVFDLLTRHVNVSHETYERLSIYHDLLLKWQNKVNLVGPDTISDAWSRHFLDSLQLMNLIHDLSVRIVDIGSGAGFPGMVLAIAGATDMHLVESDTKKVLFLKEVARLTKTNLTIHNKRIEDCSIENVSLITSRACSALENLFTFSSNFVSHETTCLFHKGKNYFRDIEDAKKQWSFDYSIVQSVTDTQGVILKIIDLKRRGHVSRE